MNPYDFVRMDWQRGVQRRWPRPHNCFGGLSGSIQGTITTLTPFFIPETDKAKLRFHRYKPFLTNREGHALIPGSSLKGLVRSLVETVGYGCWWLFKGVHEHRLPPAFHQCPQGEDLCVACRMFGLIQGNTLRMGHVGFDDATCAEPVAHDPIYTIILSSPKPHHAAFYLDMEGGLAGRKYYFHHSTPPEDVGGWRPKGAKSQKDAQNQYIKPIGAGSTFSFSAYFSNLDDDELALLLYALVLEPEMRHKLGYAKPAGLGSVEIALTRMRLVDHSVRYTSPDGGLALYEGEALSDYVARQVAPYRADNDSITLGDLRRIWRWPGRDDLRYPSWNWFRENPAARLDAT